MPRMKRLLLIGGGHAHVEVLRRFGIDRERGVEITLISPQRHAPYSGMLPGFVAGHYRWDDFHIDLELLAQRAAATVRLTTIESLDIVAQSAIAADGTVHRYDVCSIDIGSVPRMDAPGAREHGIAVKPVDRFLERWSEVATGIREGKLTSVTVVGGGAGGVEILLAMQNAVRPGPTTGTRFSIVSDTPSILSSHLPHVRAIFERVLARRNVAIYSSARVESAESGMVRCSDGRAIESDAIFWATGAGAAPWIAASGVAIDEAGFMRVNSHLQSPSHPTIFGSGDAIAFDEMRLPKSGVFAVRQGPVLSHNLRAALRGEPLRPFVTKPTALNLISTGDRCAVMAWRSQAIEGAWVWRWKDWIDRRFMRRYR